MKCEQLFIISSVIQKVKDQPSEEICCVTTVGISPRLTWLNKKAQTIITKQRKLSFIICRPEKSQHGSEIYTGFLWDFSPYLLAGHFSTKVCMPLRLL